MMQGMPLPCRVLINICCQQVLQLLPKLTKLDNDDVHIQGKTDGHMLTAETAQAAPELPPKPLESTPDLKPAAESNPVLQQLH